MRSRDEDIVQGVLAGLAEASLWRSTFENHWDDVARVVLPHYADSFQPDNIRTPGQERGLEMYDATANTALFRYASAMNSMLTPAGSRWHGIRIADPKLNKLRSVRLWCDQVGEIMFHYRYGARSGYQSQQYDSYVSQGAFGTSAMHVDELRDPRTGKPDGLRYRNIPIGELYVSENHQGLVDKVWRRWRMSARNIATQWFNSPADQARIPKNLAAALEKNPEQMFFVVHHVCPRDAWSPWPMSGKAMQFASYYVLQDGNVLLNESGYRSWPIPVARINTAPGEYYGRGPAMQVLPAIKGLNSQKKTILKQAHRAVDPVLLAHDDGILEGVNLAPGAVNYGGMNADGHKLVDVLPTGNISIGLETMQLEQAAINDGFFVTLFQILVDSPQMTATEVLERAREKGALLAPSFGRYQTEGLGPMIAREYEILVRQGKIPEPPQELLDANATWEVEYDAPLNRAIKSESVAGFQRTMQFATEIANVTQDPAVFDVFDMDYALIDTARTQSVPEAYLADPGTVQAKRQGRAQATQQQQLVDAAPAIASTLKAVGAGQVTGG